MNDGKICHFTVYIFMLSIPPYQYSAALSKPYSLSFHSFHSTNTFFITELLAIGWITLLLHGDL